MKNIVLLLVILIASLLTACGESGEDSDGKNPETPTKTKIQLRVDIASYNFPKESINWKYYVIGGCDYYTNPAASLSMAQLLGKADSKNVANAYLCVGEESNYYLKLFIYSTNDSRDQLYTSSWMVSTPSPAYSEIRQNIIDTAITWIKERPTESFSGYMDL